MKILELRFKNLNSLYGEWIIDFTDPEYSSNGLFALTGPTGAGKSTILDAICLALYGATPRLGKITKSGNEIMSRQTGECYAEVLFESQAGRYRCHWEQRKARKKAGGKLQDQEHHISEADTCKPIETKKSLVTGVIEKKTGMDFDRFTRSILLAQGGFDTFLKADTEQKSKILEQITGTEIYSQISKRVFERQREENERLNNLQSAISGIIIIEPEQEKEIHQEFESKKNQECEIAKKVSETAKGISWLTNINNLKEEIHKLSGELTELQKKVEAFKPDRSKLGQALKAASLDGIFATLNALRKQQANDQTALKNQQSTLPKLEAAANLQALSLKAAEEITFKTKKDLKAAAPLIREIRSLDQKLGEQEKAILEGVNACKKEIGKIQRLKQNREKEQESRKKAKNELKRIEKYLKEYAKDEWLIGGLAGIKEQFNSLIGRQKEIVQKEADIKNAEKVFGKAKKKLDDSTKRKAVLSKELEDAVKKVKKAKDILTEILDGRLLREYRTEKETLLREMAYIKKIEQLKDYRAKLEDGKACPLCGSPEHPFAKGNVPVPDEIEQKIEAQTKVIDKAENQESTIKKLEEAESAARENLNKSEELRIRADNNKKSAQNTIAELKDSLTKLKTGFHELKLAVLEKLKPFGITEIPENQISSLLESLKTRQKKWQEQVRDKDEIERKIAAVDSEIKSLGAVIETQTSALIERQKSLNQLKEEHAAGMDERKKLYGDKNPDVEDKRLNKAIEDAEESEKKARNLNTVMQQKLTAVKSHIESLKKSIGQRESDLIKAETDFSAELKKAGFSDEKQFLDARLTSDVREFLSSKAKKLDDALTELKARQKDRETRLSNEKTKKITDKSLEELEPQFKEYEESLKILRDNIAGIKHTLKENEAAKERIKEKQTAIAAQKKECYRWEKLNGLIGSADGKKYRNFAQGLTFELMVSHANRQLEKMTDRYLLIRDDGHPLELNVVDNYQAGEIRSTKNLSGGESFIVSLTLALGLSKMASRKVRVDSLFLDEGFGTLDEDALESSLETLANLQQEGKIIGVISHVSALKERICTQINISPISGGKSSISGAGCRKV